MSKGRISHKRQTQLLKAVFVTSLLVLIILGSTVLTVRLLFSQRPEQPARGWVRTPEIRVIMDSTADWARIMFNDLNGGLTNGIRIAEFRGRGWLSGNDTNDRIDAGRGLTFVDIIYNTTVVKTGDIVGFYKGNNDFHHTRMYVDLILEVNTDMRQVSFFLMLAGAGTTTFQLINKQTGDILWIDSETGNSFSQYARKWMAPQVLFTREQIQASVVLVLVLGTVVLVIVLNSIKPRGLKRIEYGEAL